MPSDGEAYRPCGFAVHDLLQHGKRRRWVERDASAHSNVVIAGKPFQGRRSETRMQSGDPAQASLACACQLLDKIDWKLHQHIPGGSLTDICVRVADQASIHIKRQIWMQ